MQPDQSTLLSRQRGTLPDKFWYQLNGKSATENYMEQREKMYEKLQEAEEQPLPYIIFTKEVKIR